jgi:hypothetical protein
MTNGQVLVDRAGCPVARNAKELRETLERFFQDADYREALKQRAEEYVRWFCSAYDKEAARNVADEIRKRCADA